MKSPIRTITQAVEQLPPSLRDPLLQSMHGHATRAIAEDIGVSESTARRRIQQARDQLRDELASRAADDGPWVPFEQVSDPALERSQRLDEHKFVPSLGGPQRSRGPDR